MFYKFKIFLFNYHIEFLIKHTFFSIIFLFLNISFAQNEANIWYFGNNAGLDFNSGNPIALTDGQMATQEGCASIADTNGVLRFYTDGTTVWNRNHTIMSNGTGLNGNFSSTQSAIIVPKPNSSNIYYIFTVDFQGQSNGLQYSEVDMNLDGGLGAITSNKNILLLTPVLEKLTAVNHANGNDIWVIAHRNGSAEFYAYLVTNTGIQAPVVTDIGFSYSGPFFDENAGYMKASPNGQRLAMAFPRFTNGLQLFDFDNTSGIISNHINVYDVPGAATPYGIEFSPSSDILYVAGSGSGGLAQFDITLNDAFQILSSVTFLSNDIANSDWGALQLAPDGKIYITRRANDNTPNINSLSVINNPDVLGVGCDFQLDTVSLGTGIAQSGLPPFIQSFFQVGITTENNCLGNATQFQANISESFDSILWDFGDGNTSTLQTPSHTYSNAGTYIVTLTVTSGTETTSDTAEVIIYEQPTANQPTNILVCDDNNDGFYNFDLTTQNSFILNGQSELTFEVLYYASMNDYTNQNPIETPENYINTTSYATETIIASVRNVNNNECEDSTTFSIQVLESPTPNQNVPNISACDDTSFGSDSDGIILFDLTQNETSILNGQSAADFTVSYYTDAAFTNQITSPTTYQNINSVETIYVLVENNNLASNCVTDASFTIELYELPSVNNIVELKQCDDNLDGFSVFNLNEVINEISINASNEMITFYESEIEAENETNPINNADAYINEIVSTDTVWARVENNNGCFRISQVNLIVSTTQIPSTFSRDFYECDDAVNGTTSDGISAFDFSIVNTEIEALFPAGQQLLISYYRNQADALTEQNAIINISNYRNTGYPTTQNIYIRVDSALDNDCLGLGHHITLHVETVPEANTVIIPDQCDTDGDGMYEFDTSNIENVLLNGQTNVTVTYTDESGNSLPNPLPNPFTTSSQTIIARVTNTNSLDADGACYDETSITFNVEAAAIANPISQLSICDNDSDGMGVFDTSNIETTVLNGQTEMIVTYTDESGNVLPSPLPNPFTTVSQTITVRVENPLNPICFDETSVEFIAYETPTAFTVEDDIICDDISNDGEATFILSNYDSQVLNGQSGNDFDVLYFENMTDAENNVNSLAENYILNTSVQTIYVRIHNRNNIDCYNITSFQIGITFFPIANQPDNIFLCDEEENDEIVLINLSDQNTTILNGQSATENNITYHSSALDAENGTNNLTTLYENTENPQIIYARLENDNHPECFTTTSFTINVITQPVLLMDDTWTICEGESIEITADGGFDEYLWSTGDTTQTISVSEAGTYEVIVANEQGGIRCETTKSIIVYESTIATIIEIVKTDWSQNNNSITIQVEGDGDYEYSIDGVNYQDENTFSNLLINDYLIYVRDKNGCGIVTEEVYLLYYPNFFTPNGDGYNDTWQLLNSSKEPFNKIYIFDRFGKILKELKPTDFGWDGNYRGNPMPSTDYWFLVERQNGKSYKGSFSLRR
ncbi:T9SS type B sorting domain-containing protein [Kordia sp. TARA_039_SRF]|nr:T9SS type B sorting domain-containing protein [Kordia sp. TARA_039_SRF]